jgi:uncharacterized membrane protein
MTNSGARQTARSSSALSESHLRSVLKALSWRIVATATTVLVAYLWLDDARAAAAIGGIEFFAKVPVYYLHERGWQMVPRGTVRQWFQRIGNES